MTQKRNHVCKLVYTANNSKSKGDMNIYVTTLLAARVGPELELEARFNTQRDVTMIHDINHTSSQSCLETSFESLADAKVSAQQQCVYEGP